LRVRFRPDREILKNRDAPGNRRVGPPPGEPLEAPALSLTPDKNR
jgi:hypothetical protein